jgi:putative transposase
MVSPSSRRRAAKHIVEESLGSASQACRAIGLARSSYYFNEANHARSRQQLEKRIVELSQRYPRYGYRFITALLRREGLRVNRKRVQRVRRREGLKVRKKQWPTRRLAGSNGQQQKATHPNHVWSWDIIYDQLQNGVQLRILTLIDEFTKQSLAIEVRRSIRATDAIRVIEKAIALYGLPEHIRSDNGPEFIAQAIGDWMGQKQIKTIYISPGAPWEQAYIESFHDKFRDGCLNREIFGTFLEAQIVIEAWRQEYNQCRPHSSLGYLSPDQFAAAQSSTRQQNCGAQKWSAGLGSSAAPKSDLSTSAFFPDRRAAATYRIRLGGHSPSTPARGAYG